MENIVMNCKSVFAEHLGYLRLQVSAHAMEPSADAFIALAADSVRKVENGISLIDNVSVSDANECMTMILASPLDMHMRSTLLSLINTKVQGKKNTQTLHLGSHRFLLFPTKLSLFTPGQVNMSLAFPRTTCGVCIVRYMQLVGKRSYVPICMLFFAVAHAVEPDTCASTWVWLHFPIN
jgi:hypothetical protein